MSVQISPGGAGQARRAGAVPFHRLLPRLLRSPADTFAELGRQARGEVVRLNLGPVRAHLVSRPEHVEHVLRGNWTNYLRQGRLWEPMQRLAGSTLFGEGPAWEVGRATLQPLFTTRHVESLTEDLADAVTRRVDELDEHARSGRPIDVAEEMTGIVVPVTTRVLFGDTISREEGERFARASDTALRSVGLRALLPFVPFSVPLPGDRAFTNAVTAIDEAVHPLIRRVRARPGDGSDIVSALCRAGGEGPSGDRRIRDDIVGIFLASVDTTAMALTWLWPVLDAHPGVAARLHDEIDDVVGAGPVLAEHVPRLRYTRMVLQEVLRLYPPGWIIPRTAVAPGTVGGTRIEAGSIVVASPYVTHRLDEFWDRPLDFDPERFSPDASGRRHRYAYYPFGGGPHQCLGRHLFHVEASLVVASLLSRFRPVVRTRGPFTPFPGVALRPRQRIELDLVPAGRRR